MYDAGIKLKELIRGRALLLILNRTDIADAIDATGVALTADGESFLPSSNVRGRHAAPALCVPIESMSSWAVMLQSCREQTRASSLSWIPAESMG